MSDGPEWFAPKRYGYGTGLPVSWQGWLVTILFLAAVMGAVVLLGHRPMQMIAVIVLAAILMLIITARTTRGGWRWHWGDKD